MTEYVFAFDSFDQVPGGRKHPTHPTNPTNDIKIKVQMTTNRLQIKSMELATLELPTAQQLIEDEWSQFYFSGGIAITSMERSILIKDSLYTYEATLPLTNNTIVNIDASDTTSPIFTTEFDHLLGTAGSLWNFGQSIRLIGTTIPVIISLGDNVTIRDDTRF